MFDNDTLNYFVSKEWHKSASEGMDSVLKFEECVASIHYNYFQVHIELER